MIPADHASDRVRKMVAPYLEPGRAYHQAT